MSVSQGVSFFVQFVCNLLCRACKVFCRVASRLHFVAVSRDLSAMCGVALAVFFLSFGVLAKIHDARRQNFDVFCVLRNRYYYYFAVGE